MDLSLCQPRAFAAPLAETVGPFDKLLGGKVLRSTSYGVLHLLLVLALPPFFPFRRIRFNVLRG